MLLEDIKAGKIAYLLWLEDFNTTLVVNTVEDLLLLAVSTRTDPLAIEITCT
jgi:hypothetical protein